jgi:hypothetical protein
MTMAEPLHRTTTLTESLHESSTMNCYNNIPTVPYRLLCWNSPEYEGRKLLWQVITLCQLTWHHIPEDFSLHWYHHENLKSYFMKKFYLSLCIKPKHKSHRWHMRDLHPFYLLSFSPPVSFDLYQPTKRTCHYKRYHHSQPINRMTTLWKGDVGSMMEREV